MHHPLTGPPLADYRLTLPPIVQFGWGSRHHAGKLGRRLGTRAWLVCGSRSDRTRQLAASIRQSLEDSGVELAELAFVTREPLVENVDQAVSRLRATGIRAEDFLIGLGGGSVIDLAKAVAAMTTNPGESVRDFLEGVGSGHTIDRKPLPLLAIPTTAGTGTEATRNAVISSFDPPFKKSLRSEDMVPDAVLIDPELTVSCPASVTAYSGMDAITQLLESLISRRANAFTAALCREGLERAIPALPRAIADPHDRAAREAMSHAAFLSGVALGNSGLGMAHGVAAALGVHCRVPHGLACAVMLPIALQANRDVAARTLASLVPLFSDDPCATDADAADTVIEGIGDLCRRVGIPRRLGELGVTESHLPALVRDSRGNSMNGNPRTLSDSELADILSRFL